MNRDDFRKLAETRLEDAKVLLDAGHFGAAYYFAGYAVECALKACVCKNTHEFDFPPKDTSKYYQHNLKKLAERAARSLIEVVSDRQHGVLQWLSKYW